MRKTALLLLGTGLAWGQSNPGTAQPAMLDLAAIDRQVDPCTDFYRYACGGWMKKNPVPDDQARWGRFSELNERNQQVLREILEEAAKPAPGKTADDRKIRDAYAACMDEAGIERRGMAPLEAEFARIRGLKEKSGLAALVAHLHASGVPTLFDFTSGQDVKDATEVIAQADQGGLGLPDRDYYLKTDDKSVALRAKYLTHVRRMFELAGRPAGEAQAEADAVLRVETALAKGSLDVVSRRDPEKTYHRMETQALAKLSPEFAWGQYFRGTGAPAFRSLNVAWPEFFQAMSAAVKAYPLEDWRAYLTWGLLHDEAPLLPAALAAESFDFFGRTLTGAPQMRPRWKRCVSLVDRQLGEALGRQFVDRTFGEAGKERTLEMVHRLETALGEDIGKLPWMTATTKAQAMVKLKAITNKIGFPAKWRDYSALTISRDDAVGNDLRASRFEFARQMRKIGQPVDATEWFMTPPTVNAYYDPQMNNINFPAGILQPPFYDNKADDAVNYGAIGAVIGHELTHGFDDQGSQFDAKGNLRDWWTAEDAKEFEKRAACIATQYSKFEAAPGVFVNGQLTLGEDTADNGGLRIALMALLNRLDGRDRTIEGMSGEQRFFVSFAQIWCENQREESARLQVSVDPHAPAQFRVNGAVQNSPEFRKAFACKVGQPMAPANACRVW